MLIQEQAAKSTRNFWLFCAVTGKKVQEWEQTRCHQYCLKLFFQRAQTLRVCFNKKCYLLLQPSCFFILLLGLYVQIQQYFLSLLRLLNLCKYICSSHSLFWISLAGCNSYVCNAILWNPRVILQRLYTVFEKIPTSMNCLRTLSWFIDCMMAIKVVKFYLTK